MNAEELLELPRGHHRHELIRGELRETALMGLEHGHLIGAQPGDWGIACWKGTEPLLPP